MVTFLKHLFSDKAQTDSGYNTLRRMLQDDLIELEDPKTPIANLNTSLNATQIITAAGTSTIHPSQDLQQMFTSNQSNDVHSILSPPVSSFSQQL